MHSVGQRMLASVCRLVSVFLRGFLFLRPPPSACESTIRLVGVRGVYDTSNAACKSLTPSPPIAADNGDGCLNVHFFHPSFRLTPWPPRRFATQKIWKNAQKFNHDGSPLWIAAEHFKQQLDRLYKVRRS